MKFQRSSERLQSRDGHTPRHAASNLSASRRHAFINKRKPKSRNRSTMSINDTNGSLRWIVVLGLLSSCLLSHSASGDVQVRGRTGDDVVLPCQGTKGVKILQWKKTSLSANYYVYFFREMKSYRKFQHESFRDRVKLREPNIENGDVSLILKSVNIEDTGTYECYVAYEENLELISSVNMTVSQPGGGAGHKDGHVGLAVGLSVAGVILVAGVAFVILRKKTQTDCNSSLTFPVC